MMNSLQLLLCDEIVILLFYMIILDISIGTFYAFKSKIVTSDIGLIGVIKHSIVMILILSMGVFAPLFNLEMIFTSLLLFFIIQYLVSICETCIKLNIPIPKAIYKRLKKVEKENERVEKKDEDQKH